MKKFVVALVVLAFAFSAEAGPSMHNPFFCYATDTIRSMTRMSVILGSYEAVRRYNFTTVNPYISTCTPSRFWYLGRYGNRMMNEQSVQEMIDFAESTVQNEIVRNYDAGRTSLCSQDFENIRDFRMDTDLYRIENANIVTESGEIALQNISRRFQQLFPNILTETYSATRFHFRHTGTSRTNTSIRAFAIGLFGEVGAENVVYEPVPELDWFLNPLIHCPAFDEEISGWERERLGLREGPEVQEMVEQVNRKLGFHGSNQLNFLQIISMWNWCHIDVGLRFEASNSETGPDNPWCAAFSVAHHLLIEYYRDLGYYYFSSYGVRNQRLLQNLMCGVIQDFLRHMQSENNTDTMARVFITDSNEVRAMLVALGAFRDVWPLHRHNYAQQLGRRWLTSIISPFSANLVVVRYDCEDGDHDLIFLLNEQPILVPGCNQENGACKLSVIIYRFQRFLDADCSTLFCSNN